MPSIIGRDLRVLGDLQCDGDLEVQGTVEGNIEAATVSVDRDARVDGSIRAHSLTVSGAVDGGLEAAEIALTSTARVTGELAHETLSVEPGARLEARLCRLSQERRIAAQIPKPKLNLPVDEPLGLEPPADAAESRGAADGEEGEEGDEVGRGGDGDPQDLPDTPDTEIPEVFDRRRKQATG